MLFRCQAHRKNQNQENYELEKNEGKIYYREDKIFMGLSPYHPYRMDFWQYF
jgi:hypothetical protein